MANTTRNIESIQQLITKDDLADHIVNMYTTWKGGRSGWEAEQQELRNYLFATDTTTTSNATLPWKNKTTTPKLTQIRDNLHANYMAALFPHDDWFTWRAEDSENNTEQVAKTIKAYIKNKVRQSDFKGVVSRLLYDYIDYGNAFGEVIYETQTHVTDEDDIIPKYSGPKLLRISPYDIVFNIASTNFSTAPKITRSLMSLGQLKKAIDENPGMGWVDGVLGELTERRSSLGKYNTTEVDKAIGIQVDGFGSASAYYNSGLVEVLEFEGDLFIKDTQEILSDYRVIVIDRAIVAAKKPMESWLGRTNKEHVAWRLRPDNLMGMSPLANLVGLQYRVDHLENLRADTFDQIAHPPLFIRGMVDDFEWGPNEHIYGDEESDVRVLSPDTTALAADLQIERYLNLMEEMAGAPKQAMGIRTPGEKTAFEVQQLQTAAGRIFQNKIQYFEEHFIEPLLNQMLEQARRHFNSVEQAEVFDDEFGHQEFLKITPKDLKAKGKLVPVGARHFARQAQLAQTLIGLSNSAIYQDEQVRVHMSGKKIAKMIEELLELSPFDLVQDNIRVSEAQETQSLGQTAQRQNADQLTEAVVNDEGVEGES